MRKKKVAMAAGLILVIVLCCVWLAIVFAPRGSAPPKWVMARKVEKIDVGTLEVISLSVKEWKKLGPNCWNMWKNPNTGKYSMLLTMTCKHCGNTIPRLSEHSKLGMRFDPETGRFVREKWPENLPHAADYKCPYCGEPAKW